MGSVVALLLNGSGNQKDQNQNQKDLKLLRARVSKTHQAGLLRRENGEALRTIEPSPKQQNKKEGKQEVAGSGFCRSIAATHKVTGYPMTVTVCTLTHVGLALTSRVSPAAQYTPHVIVQCSKALLGQ